MLYFTMGRRLGANEIPYICHSRERGNPGSGCPIKAGKQVVCTGNTFFDTTQGITTLLGAQVIDATCAQATQTGKYFKFKGNADVQHIRDIIKETGHE